MSLIRRMVTVLTSVSFLSAAILVGVDNLTRERIARNKQREIEAAIGRVIPGSAVSRKLYEEKGFVVFAGLGSDDRLLGYAVQATTSGFQDTIVLLFGTDAGVGRIRRLAVLEQKETPGLGARIADEDMFLRFWAGRECRHSLSLRKPPVPGEELGPSEVNAVTGATISSEAVLAGVNRALAKLRQVRQRGLIAEGGDDAR